MTQEAEKLLQTQSIPIPKESFDAMFHLYQFQNRKELLVPIEGINPETEEPAHFELLPFYGEEMPHYGLLPRSYEGRQINFFAFGSVEQGCYIIPFKASRSDPDTITEAERKALASIVPYIADTYEKTITTYAQKKKPSILARLLGHTATKP